MQIYEYNKFGHAYSEILADLLYNPEFETSPRGMKINEILNANIVIKQPQYCLFKNYIRDLPLDYLCKELLLYFSGTRQLKYFAKASKFWNKIANKDNTVNSAYGDLIFNPSTPSNISQFEWAKECLIRDKDSRQAIIHFNKPIHQDFEYKDFPCTIYGIFHIRNNRLYFKISMRSNDVFLGLTFDVPFFCIVQLYMYQELKQYYPNLTIGSYTHNADSLHMYERDFEVCESMYQNEFNAYKIPMPNLGLVLHPDLLDIFEYSYNNIHYDSFIAWLQSNV